jgi:hypothetical protein
VSPVWVCGYLRCVRGQASKQAYLGQGICTLQSDIHISTSDINVHSCSHSLRSPLVLRPYWRTPRCQPPSFGSSCALLLPLQSTEHPRAPPVRRSLCAAHRGCECVACCVCCNVSLRDEIHSCDGVLVGMRVDVFKARRAQCKRSAR